MGNNLKEIIVLNGPMLVRVEGDHIQISAYQHEARLPFLPKDTPIRLWGLWVRKRRFKLHINFRCIRLF